jgi:adenylate kinase family enzyme
MTAPLADYYDEKGLLFTVEATSSDDVVKAVNEKLA